MAQLGVRGGITDPTGLSGQVAGILRTAILDGTYPADTALPTQLELARLHGISEATVNRAFGELAREGLVRTGSGRRTIVCALTAYEVTVGVDAAENLAAPRGGWRAAVRAAWAAFPAVSRLDLANKRPRWTWTMVVRSADPALAAGIGLAVARRVAGPSGWDFADSAVSAKPVS